MDIDEITIDEHAGKDLDSDYFYISVAVLIVETRKTSQFLQLLAEKLPLSALGLQHIKRVRKGDNNNKTVEIVLIPVDQIESVDKEIWSKCGLEGGILNNHASVKIVRVAKFLPKNRREFSIWGSKWPVNFYPDEIERQRELGLSEQEVTYITSIIHTLLDLHSHSHIHHTSHEKALTESIHGLNLALIANPTTGNVVCTSAQGLSRLQEQLGDSASAHTHPLYLPTLLCINQVAAICRGDVDGKDLLLPGQYLCTGLDLFIHTEPDLFASMALVHSRIRRVFYLEPDESSGALGSGVHLHDLPGLNHHYRVFRVHGKGP